MTIKFVDELRCIYNTSRKVKSDTLIRKSISCLRQRCKDAAAEGKTYCEAIFSHHMTKEDVWEVVNVMREEGLAIKKLNKMHYTFGWSEPIRRPDPKGWRQ